MAVSVILRNIVRNPVTGSVTLQFDDVEYEFSSVSDAQQWLADAETPQLAQRLCVAYLRSRSPNLTNLSSVKDKQFILDLSSANPIKVQ